MQQEDLQIAPDIFDGSPRAGLTKEVLALLAKETEESFHVLEGEHTPETAERLADLTSMQVEVGLGRIACPVCGGTLWAYKVAKGSVTGVKVLWPSACPCRFYRAYYRNWFDAIDRRYLNVTWQSLAPYSGPDMRLSVERQEKIISFVQAHPDDSYLLYGTYGTGKTHLSVALHQYHLAKWAQDSWMTDKVYCPVMRANVTTLLDQHHARKMQKGNDDAPRPSIDLARIASVIRQGDKPVLIMDELDKLGGQPTPFKLETVLALVDAVYQAGGVIIATSNQDEDYFLRTWGEELGGPLIRRITSGAKAHKIEFRD
jgi:hypothetical protein